MGLIEKRGTGIQVILTSCREMNLKPPKFEEGPNWFKVTLFTESAAGSQPTKSQSEAIRELFETNVSITSAQVMKAFGMSKATAVKYLEQLIREGTIKRIGRGPKTEYVVVG
jgi:predicted HTH transcriptional regulator